MPLPSTDTVINDVTELSRATTQTLTDSETQKAFSIIMEVQTKYAMKLSTPENLDAYRDELLTRLMEVNVLASFDPTPLLQGGRPIVEIIGKVPSDDLHKHGFDHERMGWEVTKAGQRNEEVLGQREALPGKVGRRAAQHKKRGRKKT